MTDTRPVLAAHRWKNNGELIADLHRLDIIRDLPTLDPTYGRGVWWSRWRPTDLTVIGMEPGHECGVAANFLQLPFADNTFAQAAWDPPYVAKGGRDTSTMRDHQNRYGLTRGPKNPAEALALWVDGLVEVARVVQPGGLIFAKGQNAISSAAQHWTAEDASLAARSMGLRKVGQCLFVNNGSAQDKSRTRKCPECRGIDPEECEGPCDGTGRAPSVQVNPRNNYSFLMLFQVPKVLRPPVRDPLARIAELEAAPRPVVPLGPELMAYDPAEPSPTGLLVGDCRERLAELPDASVHSVVADPPYGLSKEPDITEVLTHWMAGDDFTHTGGGFMGKDWDGYVPGPATWREVFRVLKPGGHAVVFAGSRTYDMMTLALRMAGFEIRDSLQWLYGSGFPKGQNVGKAIDKAAGVEREVVGVHHRHGGGSPHSDSMSGPLGTASELPLTAPATPEAERWEGWNTALKPGFEPIILARKPLEVGGRKATVVANVLEHGTGALNVDATRIGTTDDISNHARGAESAISKGIYGDSAAQETHQTAGQALGRWPANVLLSHHEDCVQVGERKVKGHPGYPNGPGGKSTHYSSDCHPECPVAMLDTQSGQRTTGGGDRRSAGTGRTVLGNFKGDEALRVFDANSDGPSRFFATFEPDLNGPRFLYAPKAARSERNAGMPDGSKNSHATVKPVAVMRWLVRLVTPPDGVVLDPFLGSGTTAVAAELEGIRWLGVERDAEYLSIIEARVAWAAARAVGQG